MKVLSPFGPKIASLKLSGGSIRKINVEVDKIISKKNLLKKLDYSNNLVGQVRQEFQLPKIFIKKNLEKILYKAVKDYIFKSLGKNISKIKIKNFWIVRQFNDEYNPVHFHDGHISGVGYLKLPKTFGETFQKNKKENYNGKLQLVHGSRMFLSPINLNIQPELGDFYFFPNYLMHCVYPFLNSNEERRSISFNAHIDNDIYNVHGSSLDEK